MTNTSSKTRDKDCLRDFYRHRRNRLTTPVQLAHARSVCTHLKEAQLHYHANHIAGYLAIDGELNLKPTFEFLSSFGVQLSVPQICDKDLRFVRWTNRMPLVKGLYGIPVPEKPIDCKLPDHCVLLVPVVAFTERAERLGQGGGYFDRFLTEHSQLLAIGIAHSCQQIDSFPVAGHDRPLDAVLTEAGWITANEKTRKRLNIVS